MKQIIQNTARAFANVDVSAENARLGELRAELARIDEATGRADDRRASITRERQALRDRERDGSTIADALLAEVDATEAAALAPTMEALGEEFEVLGAGLRDLRRRRDEVTQQIAEAESAAFGKTIVAAVPLVEALESQAIEAIEKLIQVYASLSAVSDVTRSGAKRRVRSAVEGVLRDNELGTWRRTAPVSPEIREVLSVLAGKGRALPVAVPEIAFLP